MKKVMVLFSITLLSYGCSFVKVSDNGALVAQAKAPDVVNCESLGEVESQTRDRVLISRNRGSVRQELIDLARNQAASMGANAIVPASEPLDGRQKFYIYRCN